MQFFKNLIKFFSKKELVPIAPKELTPEEIARQEDRERRFAEFEANQPEEIECGEDIFGEPIILKKSKTSGDAPYYSAPVKILDFGEKAELLSILQTHRTSRGEYIA